MNERASERLNEARKEGRREQLAHFQAAGNCSWLSCLTALLNCSVVKPFKHPAEEVALLRLGGGVLDRVRDIAERELE